MDVTSRFRATEGLIREQLQLIELNVRGANGLSQHWEEFFPDYMQQIEDFAQTWMADRIRQIRLIYASTDPRPSNADQVLLTLNALESKIRSMTIPR